MPTTVSALDLPFDEAIAFFRQKASVPTKAWTDVYAAAHSRSFMVAGAASEALLDDFRAEIDQALTEGTTLADFRQGFDRIVEKHGWEYEGKRGWRTRIIFETNMRAAYSAGRYAQQTLPETLEAFPFWQYQHSGAIHPRREHLAWDGMVLPANAPFWRTNYPPNGWHCGCFSIPISRGALRRQGKSGPDEAPDLVFRAEEVGGVVRRVPQGVDAGFEYNPGQAWLTGGRPFEPIATDALISAFESMAKRNVLPAGASIPIAPVPQSVIDDLAIEAGARARLTVQTILDHADRPQITAQDYAALASEALQRGDLRADGKGRLAAVVEIDGHPHVVGFKVDAHGAFLVTTVHRSRPVRAKRIRGGRPVGKARET